jgi:hypothetical protein
MENNIQKQDKHNKIHTDFNAWKGWLSFLFSVFAQYFLER